MTLTLHQLDDNFVFESTPKRPHLGGFHVRFDDLIGNQRTEARLDKAIRNREPVALIGPSGSGKSSVIAFVLGSQAPSLAPMYVPVAAMPSGDIGTPTKLADHMLNTIAKFAGPEGRSALESVADETTTLTKSRRAGIGLGWRWLHGDLASEVERQIQLETRATLDDKADALGRVFAAIRAQKLRPVLIFDDTDRWLQGGLGGFTEYFFVECVRWLLDLTAPIVMAVHPTYLTDSNPQTILRHLDTQIRIPQVEDADGIGAILGRRIERRVGVDNPDVLEVLSHEALEAVLSVYRETGSLRRAIQVCHIALHEAISDSESTIGASHIRAAAFAG